MATNKIETGSPVGGGTYQFEKVKEEPISTTVTFGLADVLDCDIEALEPLENVLDVDAVNSLVESGDSSVRVEFVYADCLVTVKNGTEVTITPKA